MSIALPLGYQQSSPVGSKEKEPGLQTKGENESHGLQPELGKVRLAAESGELLAMKTKSEKHCRPEFTHHETSFNYIKPITRDRNTVYSLRYTHETPLGKLEDKRGHVDDFFANDESDLQRRKPKLKQGMEALKAKKKQWAKTSCGRRTKVVVTCVLVVVTIVTILVVLYFKAILEQGQGYQQ
jgi:hypothetical protein